MISTAPDSGADSQIRTGDLILTKVTMTLFYNDLGRVLFHSGRKEAAKNGTRKGKHKKNKGSYFFAFETTPKIRKEVI